MKELDYEQQTELYDKNCLNCPHSLIQIKKGNKKLKVSYEQARSMVLYHSSISMVRGCSFGEEEFTLREIIANPCIFWGDTTPAPTEDEAFLIIEDFDGSTVITDILDKVTY